MFVTQKAVDVINNLKSYGTDITVYDPWASPAEVRHEYGLNTTKILPNENYDAIVLTVAHNQFLEIDLRGMLSKNAILYDVKGILECKVDGRL